MRKAEVRYELRVQVKVKEKGGCDQAIYIVAEFKVSRATHL